MIGPVAELHEGALISNYPVVNSVKSLHFCIHRPCCGDAQWGCNDWPCHSASVFVVLLEILITELFSYKDKLYCRAAWKDCINRLSCTATWEKCITILTNKTITQYKLAVMIGHTTELVQVLLWSCMMRLCKCKYKPHWRAAWGDCFNIWIGPLVELHEGVVFIQG